MTANTYAYTFWTLWYVYTVQYTYCINFAMNYLCKNI